MSYGFFFAGFVLRQASPMESGRCQWSLEGEHCQAVVTQVLVRPPVANAVLCDQHARAAIEFLVINLRGEQQHHVRQAESLQPDIDHLNALLNGLNAGGRQ